MALNYNYTTSKAYAEFLGLVWLGDDYWGLIAMDDAARKSGLTQEQVDEGMRHHLMQVKTLFTPSGYKWYQRIAIAFYFLTGWKPKGKK